MDGWMTGWDSQWVNRGWVDERIVNGWMDGWTNGRMDGRTDI